MRFLVCFILLSVPSLCFAKGDFYLVKLRTLMNGKVFESKNLIIEEGHPLDLDFISDGILTEIQVQGEVTQKSDRQIQLLVKMTQQDQDGKKTKMDRKILTLVDGSEGSAITGTSKNPVDSGVWISAVRL